MPKVRFVQPDGVGHVVDAEDQRSLMEAARNNMIPGIDADRGGSGACATCHVHVDPDWIQAVGAANDMEQAMLEFVHEPNITSRLSCQIMISEALDGLIVRLPAQQG